MANGDFSLTVLTFDDENDARAAVESLRQLHKAGRLNIEDTAVIRRDPDGKLHVDNQVDSAVKVGAAVGGMLGLLLGAIAFPIGGLIIGAAGGAAIGKMTETGVDKKFVEDVSNSLEPGTSALFVTATGGDPAAVAAALRPYKGKVYHTTLSSEAEDTLRRALAG